MRRYQIGQEVKNEVTFTDPVTGLVDDPSVVRLKIRTGAGRELTLTYGTDADIVRVSKGRYRVRKVVDSAGPWYFRWVATGSLSGADEQHIHVDASAFNRPL